MPSVYTISGAPFGQEPAAPPPVLTVQSLQAVIKKREDEINRVKKQSWYVAGGSAVIGIFIGIFVGIAVKGS